jgi:uncharacterized cofD-like protein
LESAGTHAILEWRRSQRLPRKSPPVGPEPPLKIVSIGGGTGLSTLLRGLKRYVKAAEGALELTAIVTVTDDGGSSGRLRREFDVLPPGDIRSCMVALAEYEGLISSLFQYRFSTGRGLKGHSFGNLFLTAMTGLTGDFAHAVTLSSQVLSVLGSIYPATSANVELEATLADGRKIRGETRISRSTSRIERIALRPRDSGRRGECGRHRGAQRCECGTASGARHQFRHLLLSRKGIVEAHHRD